MNLLLLLADKPEYYWLLRIGGSILFILFVAWLLAQHDEEEG